MKKLFLILSLLPTLLFAQQDSTRHGIRISILNCTSKLPGTYHDRDTISLSVILKHPYIEISCGQVLSFAVSVPVNGVYVDKQVSGSNFPSDLLEIFKSDKYDCYILIKCIYYRGAGNVNKPASGGITLHLIKK
jgi:hypothetical protein